MIVLCPSVFTLGVRGLDWGFGIAVVDWLDAAWMAGRCLKASEELLEESYRLFIRSFMTLFLSGRLSLLGLLDLLLLLLGSRALAGSVEQRLVLLLGLDECVLEQVGICRGRKQ